MPAGVAMQRRRPLLPVLCTFPARDLAGGSGIAFFPTRDLVGGSCVNSWGVALQNASDGDRKGSITARRVVWFPPPRCVIVRSCLLVLDVFVLDSARAFSVPRS